MSKKIIISGANGTIGKPLTSYLQNSGFTVIPWDRTKISITDYHQMESFILSGKAEAVIHLAAITSFDPELRKDSWQVNYEWPSELAWICRIHNIKFVFASTAMVFSIDHPGPYYPDTPTSATEGYGFEKRKAEERVFYQNPESVVIRLGWQIAGEGQNSMITYLDDEMQNHGVVRASEKWLPSCSFVEDTIKIFCQSLDFEKGIYQLNANKNMSFYDMANFLNKKHNKRWKIIPVKDHNRDQRMFDPHFQLPGLLRVDYSE